MLKVDLVGMGERYERLTCVVSVKVDRVCKDILLIIIFRMTVIIYYFLVNIISIRSHQFRISL